MTLSDFFGYVEAIHGFQHLIDQGLGLRCRWALIRDCAIGHRLRYMKVCIRVSRCAPDELVPHVSDAVEKFQQLAKLDVKVHNMDLPSAGFTDLLRDLQSSLHNTLPQATIMRVRGVRRSGIVE
ncbi:hypothetical protein CERZMDRAFT_94021 [Cercospora zeae-maydis SCOH1-5]|uniref:Uncharacterized protein n=1 Tax=Cercospora zeae-maydis SCOH1-5 TaxID=717836 RepID=A0A6A6FQ66_9PEZI|nr:hypothetical protein CERZMDRAFT_94021 [Cercospora zeae-maydis SCOH1-5]